MLDEGPSQRGLMEGKQGLCSGKLAMSGGRIISPEL